MDVTGIRNSVTQLNCHKVKEMMKELTEHGIIERKRNMNEETEEEMSARVVAQGSTLFGGNLYNIVRKSAKDEENILLSPTSASIVLAMATVGAKGSAAEEMIKGLELPERRDILVGYKEVLGVLLDNNSCKLNMANELFVQQGYRLDESYVEALEMCFYTEPTTIDFAQVEETRGLINGWVEQETGNKVVNMIPEGILSELTKMMLVNALHFKGSWAEEFDEKMTTEQPFHVSGTKIIMAKLMNRTMKVRATYLQEIDADIVELPYRGRRLGMYVVLPRQKYGLDRLEDKISAMDINELFGKAYMYKELDVFLPSFKLEQTIRLTEYLKQLGMNKMFGEEADFSIVAGAKGELFISEVMQKVFIEVNEEGTEAAAATGVAFRKKCAPEPKTEFKCDHPFLFYIRDNWSEMILFSGRMVDPSA